MGQRIFNNMQEVYTYCKEKLYGNILKQVKNREAAEDITSDIFTEIAAHAEWFIGRDASKQMKFVSGVYKKVMSEYLKRKKNEKTVEFKEAMYDGLLSNEDRLVFMEEDTVKKNFNNLSQAEKDVAERIYLKMESVKEIAETNKITENAVYQRFSRANKKIKKNIENQNGNKNQRKPTKTNEKQ